MVELGRIVPEVSDGGGGGAMEGDPLGSGTWALPCIRGLRIPVATILGQLAAGRSHEEILGDFPEFEDADIFGALEFTAAAVQEREVPLVG